MAPMDAARVRGIALVVVSAAAFGALGVLARVAYDDGAQPVAVLLCRFGIAAVCCTAVLARSDRVRPSRRTMRGLVLMGGCYLCQSLCYFLAVDHAPPGLVALLLYSFPAMVVIGAALFLHQPLTRRLATACAVALAGVAVVVGPSAGAGEPVGIAFGLGAAVVYSAYILLGARVLEAADPLWATTVIMSTAAIGYVVLFAVTPHRPAFPTSASGWWAVIAIAVVCTVIAAFAFLAGLARVGPSDASTLSTVEPVVSVLLSAAVTGEAVTGWTALGAVLVLGAVVAISRSAAPALAEPAPAA